jgi:hypothetical protein
MDGYCPKPILAVQPKIKKISRSKCLLVSLEEEDHRQEEKGEQSDGEQVQVPVTPIRVM